MWTLKPIFLLHIRYLLMFGNFLQSTISLCLTGCEDSGPEFGAPAQACVLARHADIDLYGL